MLMYSSVAPGNGPLGPAGTRGTPGKCHDQYSLPSNVTSATLKWDFLHNVCNDVDDSMC